MKKSNVLNGVFFLCFLFSPIFAGQNAVLSNEQSAVLSNESLSSETDFVSNSVRTTPSSKKEKNGGFLEGLSDLFRMGGFFIWPLLFLSVLGTAYVAERSVFYLSRPISDEKLLQLIQKGGGVKEVKDYLAFHSSRMGDVIFEVIRLSKKRKTVEQLDKVLEIGINIQVAELQKGFTMIAAVINLAPLVGFLGTVSGMIAAFASIANSDQVSVTLVARGIQEALVTTEVGLVIAIVVNFFYSLFQQSIEKLGQYSVDAGETLIERITEDEN